MKLRKAKRTNTVEFYAFCTCIASTCSCDCTCSGNPVFATTGNSKWTGTFNGHFSAQNVQSTSN